MRPGRYSLTLTFMTWLSVALLVVGLIIGTVSRVLIASSMERDLRLQAEEICRPLARRLADDVWEIDERAIAGHVADHLASNPDIAGIRVLTEFGDPIVSRPTPDTMEALTVRMPIRRDRVGVGFVEVSLRRDNQNRVLSALNQTSLMLTVGGLVAILLVTTLGVRLIITRPLRVLVRGIRKIAAGDYSRRLPDHRHLEIHTINHEINLMAGQIAARTEQLREEILDRQRAERELSALKDALELQVADRTRELQSAYDQLQVETRERHQVQTELLETSAREQRRIGHDLHDSLGQQLAGLSFLVGSLERRLATLELPEAETIREVGEHLRGAVAQARQISRGLSPVDLSDEGLIDSLHELARNAGALFGLDCAFTHSPDCRIRDNAVATHLYHITQEALHNARVHGHARHLWIRLDLQATPPRLIIRDDGSGMPAGLAAGATGMGMRTMRYRAESIGGNLQVTHNELGGVTVTVTFQTEPVARAPGQPLRQSA